MKKLLCMSIMVLILITGCSSGIKGCSNKEELNARYDNDEWIANGGGLHYYVTHYSTGSNGLGFRGTLTGIEDLWTYTIHEKTAIGVSHALSVESGGRAKLVLVDPDKQVTILTENADQTTQEVMTTQYFTLEKSGQYKIKIVGQDDPKCSLTLFVDRGKYVDNFSD